MRPNLNLSSDTLETYQIYTRVLWVMGNTGALLGLSSMYTQKGFEDFYVKTVFIVTFLITFAYYIFLTYKDKGYYSYFEDRFREYGKTPFARTMSLIALISLSTRFVLQDNIVFYVQNYLYMAAIVFFFFGIFFLIFSIKKS